MSRRMFFQEADAIFYFPSYSDTWFYRNYSDYAKITEIPSKIQGRKVDYKSMKQVTDAGNMFWRCSMLTTIPLFDTSNLTMATSMFSDCSSLKTVPLFDTSKVTQTGEMFFRCGSLTSVPSFDFSSNISANCMFQNCTSLTDVAPLNTSNLQYMNEMFYGCSSLPAVFPFTIDLSSVEDAYGIESMFFRSSVTTVRFKNVPSSIVEEVTSSNLGSQLTSIIIENTI